MTLFYVYNRLLQASKLEIPESDCDLQIHYKWGIDGASGQSQYKQIWKTQFNEDCSDSSVLMTSLVPLEISSTSSSTVLWRNPQPSSTNYCRPIKFEFTKETEETIKHQYKFVQDQIDKLIPISITFNGSDLCVKHQLELTMVDGKVVNNLTETSSSNCNICGAKPSQMNNISELKKLICNKDHYKFGLSTLHCWIRFFECLLHIAYRLPIKKWKVTGDHKNVVQENKKRIQLAFKTGRGMYLLLLTSFTKTFSV